VFVLPVNRVNTSDQPDANIMDFVPLVNNLPSPANPAVPLQETADHPIWTLQHPS